MGWTLIADEQLSKLNLGIIEKPHIVFVNANLSEQFQTEVKKSC